MLIMYEALGSIPSLYPQKKKKEFLPFNAPATVKRKNKGPAGGRLPQFGSVLLGQGAVF